MKITKQTILWVTLAVIVRLVLSAISYHPDLSGQLLSSYFFAYKNITNIYDHLAGLLPTHPLVQNFGVSDIFIYPPLTYFTLGTFLKIFAFIVPEQFFLDLMNGTSIYTFPDLWTKLITFKLPYLLVDILAGFSLASLFDDHKQKKTSLLLWLFNPVSLYATYLMGVFDIIPVLFTLLALYFAKRRNLHLSAAMISIGTAYKQYPIFLLPFIILSAKTFKDKVMVILCGLIPYLLTVAPFLSSSAFKYMVFGAKSQKMFYMEWMVSGAEGVYPYILGLILIYLYAARNTELIHNLWKYFLAYFLLLFSVTHFHPQWFLWLSPFLVIELVANHWRNLWLILIVLGCYLFIVLTFDNSLSVGLFAVVNHNLSNFPGVDKLLSAKTDIFLLKSTVRSLFAGVSLFLILDSFKHDNRQK